MRDVDGEGGHLVHRLQSLSGWLLRDIPATPAFPRLASIDSASFLSVLIQLHPQHHDCCSFCRSCHAKERSPSHASAHGRLNAHAGACAVDDARCRRGKQRLIPHGA